MDEVLRAHVEAWVGPIVEVDAVGRGATHIVEADAARVVVKRISAPRAVQPLLAVGRALAATSPPLAPRALGGFEDRGAGYVIWEFVEGAQHPPGTPGWSSMWADAQTLLDRLAASELRPPWDLERLWLERVAAAPFADEPAERAREWLCARAPDGEPRLAHGDFSPQNIVLARGVARLIDWEEVGVARPGFDAGWLLAQNRAGAGPRLPQPVLEDTLTGRGVSRDDLRWFEGLGLLRLLWRAETLTIADDVRPRVLAGVRQAIVGWLAEADPTRRR